jgi:2'-5' RNA ligase
MSLSPFEFETSLSTPQPRNVDDPQPPASQSPVQQFTGGDSPFEFETAGKPAPDAPDAPGRVIKPREQKLEEIRAHNPEFANTAEDFLNFASQRGVPDAYIKSGYRTAERQHWLHTHGYPTKGNDGYEQISPHQGARAIDWSTQNPANRTKLHSLIAEYSQQHRLHVPADEPWHMAAPAKKPAKSEPPPKTEEAATPFEFETSKEQAAADPEAPDAPWRSLTAEPGRTDEFAPPDAAYRAEQAKPNVIDDVNRAAVSLNAEARQRAAREKHARALHNNLIEGVRTQLVTEAQKTAQHADPELAKKLVDDVKNYTPAEVIKAARWHGIAVPDSDQFAAAMGNVRAGGFTLHQPTLGERSKSSANQPAVTANPEQVRDSVRRQVVAEREKELNSGVITNEYRDTPGYFTPQGIDAEVDKRIAAMPTDEEWNAAQPEISRLGAMNYLRRNVWDKPDATIAAFLHKATATVARDASAVLPGKVSKRLSEFADEQQSQARINDLVDNYNYEGDKGTLRRIGAGASHLAFSLGPQMLAAEAGLPFPVVAAGANYLENGDKSASERLEQAGAAYALALAYTKAPAKFVEGAAHLSPAVAKLAEKYPELTSRIAGGTLFGTIGAGETALQGGSAEDIAVNAAVGAIPGAALGSGRRLREELARPIVESENTPEWLRSRLAKHANVKNVVVHDGERAMSVYGDAKTSGVGGTEIPIEKADSNKNRPVVKVSAEQFDELANLVKSRSKTPQAPKQLPGNESENEPDIVQEPSAPNPPASNTSPENGQETVPENVQAKSKKQLAREEYTARVASEVAKLSDDALVARIDNIKSEQRGPRGQAALAAAQAEYDKRFEGNKPSATPSLKDFVENPPDSRGGVRFDTLSADELAGARKAYREHFKLADPSTTTTIDAAAHEAAPSPNNDRAEPSDAQIKAGNYKKGHVSVAGLNISVENPAGSERSGVDSDGKPWSVAMKSHYGYIKRTEGADGEHVDAYVRPGLEKNYEGPVFVVNQTKGNGQFDEHKVMIGWPDEARAKAAYLENYQSGWTNTGTIARFENPAAFKSWLRDEDSTKPAEQVNADSSRKPTQEMASAESQTTEKSPLRVPEGVDEPQQETKYKFSSTQVNLPKDIADEVRQISSRIPDAHLSEDGREENPHTTVKFGLHTDDVADVRPIIENEAPIKVKIGKVSTFPPSESSNGAEVLKLDVDSPDLHRLNKKLSTLPHTDTFEYKPHITLAYVKEGLAKKYVGKKHALEGREVTVSSIAFSSKHGKMIEIPLKGNADVIKARGRLKGLQSRYESEVADLENRVSTGRVKADDIAWRRKRIADSANDERAAELVKVPAQHRAALEQEFPAIEQPAATAVEEIKPAAIAVGDRVQWTGGANKETKTGKIVAIANGEYGIRVEGTTERVRVPATHPDLQLAPAEAKQPVIRTGKAKLDPTKQSLAEAVHSAGGIRYDKSLVNKGELDRLSSKEGGRIGLVNQNGMTAEAMAMHMAELGYRGDWVEAYNDDAGQGYDVDGNAFLEALENDHRGINKSWSEEHDWEDDYRNRYGDDEALTALDKLFADDRGGPLADKVASGKADEAETEEFEQLAKSHGVPRDTVDTIVREGDNARYYSHDTTEDIQGSDAAEAPGRDSDASEPLTDNQLAEGYTLAADGTLVDPEGQPLFKHQLGSGIAAWFRRFKAELVSLRVRHASTADLVKEAEIEAAPNRLKLNEAAYELFKRIYEKIHYERTGKRELQPFSGVFNDPRLVRRLLNELKHIGVEHPAERNQVNSLVKTFRQAAAPDSTVILYTSDDALIEEYFHRASFLGSKGSALVDRIADFEQFAERIKPGQPYFDAAIALVKRGYPEDPPQLIEELAAHYFDGDFLGGTIELADTYLADWTKAYTKRNGDDSLEEFDRAIADAERALAGSAAAPTSSDAARRRSLLGEGRTGHSRAPRQSGAGEPGDSSPLFQRQTELTSRERIFRALTEAKENSIARNPDRNDEGKTGKAARGTVGGYFPREQAAPKQAPKAQPVSPAPAAAATPPPSQPPPSSHTDEELLREVDRILADPTAKGYLERIQNYARKLPRELQRAITAEFTPLRTAEAQLIGKQRLDLAAKAELLPGASGQAELDLLRFQTNVVAPIAKLAPQFNRYLLLHRIIDRLTHDAERKKVADWTIEKAQQTLAALKKKTGDVDWKRIEKAAAAFQGETDATLQLRVDAGLISPEVYDAIKASSDFYAPFKVMKYVTEQMTASKGGGRRIPHTEDLIDRIKGIEDEDFQLQDFLLTAAQQIYQTRILAEKNRFMRDDVAPLATADPDGEIIRVARPTRYYQIEYKPAQEILDQLSYQRQPIEQSMIKVGRAIDLAEAAGLTVDRRAMGSALGRGTLGGMESGGQIHLKAFTSEVMSHELGHTADVPQRDSQGQQIYKSRNVFGTRRDILQRLSSDINTSRKFQRELAAVVEHTGLGGDDKYRASAKERFAEFMELYIHNPKKARELAPTWTDYFEKSILPNPKVKHLVEGLASFFQKVDALPNVLTPLKELDDHNYLELAIRRAFPDRKPQLGVRFGDKPRDGYKIEEYLDNGTVKALEVRNDFAKALEGLHRGEASIVSRAAILAAQPFKLGATTFNLAFQPVNLFFSDLPRATLMSKYGVRRVEDLVRFPADWLYSLYTAAAGNFGYHNELYEEFMKSGAYNSTVQRALTPEAFKPELGVTKQPLPKRVLHGVAKIGNAIEETSKLLGIRRGIRFENLDKLDPEEQRAKMREIASEVRRFSGSPDFWRKGIVSTGQTLENMNLLFMFVNARIQGTAADVSRLAGRAGGKKVAGAAWMKLALAVGIPTLTLMLHNLSDDDQEIQGPEGTWKTTNRESYNAIPLWERENYFMIPRNQYFLNDRGERVRDYWKLPKREIIQLMANVIEGGVQFADNKDPATLKQFAGNFLENLSPINVSGNSAMERAESVVGSMNPIIKTPAEVIFNRDTFRHRKIVPDYIDHVKSPDLPPEDQYTRSTSDVFVKLGHALGVSPLLIEHSVRGGSAGLLTQFIPPKQQPGRSPILSLPAVGPIARRFVRSESTAKESDNEVLDEALKNTATEKVQRNREAYQLYQSWKKNPDGKTLQAYLDEHSASPETGKQVLSLKDDDDKNLTSDERQIKQLGVESGDRAAYLKTMLNGKSEEQRQQLLLDWRQKGIASIEVLRQLRLNDEELKQRLEEKAKRGYLIKARQVSKPPPTSGIKPRATAP